MPIRQKEDARNVDAMHTDQLDRYVIESGGTHLRESFIICKGQQFN